MGNYGIDVLASIKVVEYFTDSNFAGKVVIFVLVFLNCTAIALMWSKFQEIKRALRNNARDEKRINNLTAIFDYDDSLFPGEGSPYLRICSRAMDAAHRGKQQGKVRMNYVENAIRRALAEVGDRYEAKMYWLATIVSGAPFLGLLGTVWGVMDAFGTMDAGGATIEHLAPGVSGGFCDSAFWLLAPGSHL